MPRKKRVPTGRTKTVKGKRYKLSKSRWRRDYIRKRTGKKHSNILHGFMGAGISTATTGAAYAGAGALATKLFTRGGHNIYKSRLAAAKHPMVVMAGFGGMTVGMVGAAALTTYMLKRKYEKELISGSKSVRWKARKQIATGVQSSTTGSLIGGIVSGPLIGTMLTIGGLKGIKGAAKFYGEKLFKGKLGRKVAKPFKAAAGRWQRTAGHQGVNSATYKRLTKQMERIKKQGMFEQYAKGEEYANAARIMKKLKQQKGTPFGKRMFHFVTGKPWVAKVRKPRVRRPKVRKQRKNTRVYRLGYDQAGA